MFTKWEENKQTTKSGQGGINKKTTTHQMDAKTPQSEAK